MSVLRVEGVRKSYGDKVVLSDLDLTVEEHDVVCLIGASGSGKSTLLRVACGLMEPTAGKVLVAGRDVTGCPSEELARRGLVTIPEGKGVFPNLTVRENLQMATYSGLKLSRIEAVAYEQFPRLGERHSQLAGTLSGGEQQMLAIGRGLMAEPRLLILDEPSLGLSPLLVEEMFGLIRGLNADGLSVLLVEQNIPLALRVTDEVHVLSRGRIVHSCPPHALWENQEIKARYLGL